MHSNLGVVIDPKKGGQSCPPIFGLEGIVQIGRISRWCTRKCHSPRAPHRTGGQVGCGHSNPGNGAAFTGRYSRGTDPGRWQAEQFINVPVGSAFFGGREEVGVIHREANHLWIFAIFRNSGNGQFDRDRLTSMLKHIDMGEKG
ncbi:hypothetical protein TNCV_768671 [Trichonephila clavipes]|nr:hypothetical protein TNCV_768671 [Trichonephila clavipes]